MKKIILVTMAAIGIAGGVATQAGGLPVYHGEPGDALSANRVITIKPNAKWVNVSSGETVKFVDVASGKSFVWQFDMPGSTAFDLVAVAPQGVLAEKHLTVFVAQGAGNAD
jgi:Heavy-metal resistance protein CzcE